MGIYSSDKVRKECGHYRDFAPFSSGETPASCTGQTGTGLADDLDKALSEWINGNLSDEDMGEICGQYHEAGRKRLADESGKDHSGDKPAIKVGAETEFAQEIVERVAVAGLKRAIRNSRFDDPTEFPGVLHKELEGDWTSHFGGIQDNRQDDSGL